MEDLEAVGSRERGAGDAHDTSEDAFREAEPPHEGSIPRAGASVGDAVAMCSRPAATLTGEERCTEGQQGRCTSAHPLGSLGYSISKDRRRLDLVLAECHASLAPSFAGPPKKHARPSRWAIRSCLEPFYVD